jgi:hypothetical protein
MVPRELRVLQLASQRGKLVPYQVVAMVYPTHHPFTFDEGFPTKGGALIRDATICNREGAGGLVMGNGIPTIVKRGTYARMHII